jgi:transglutaminase-like putative cysteine protease
MLIRVGSEWRFVVSSPTPAFLKLYLHPSQQVKLRQPEQFQIEPETAREEFIDEFGNRAVRLVLPAGSVRLWGEAIVEDGGQPDSINWEARQIPVPELPLEVLPYLLGSRYCEVDRLSEVAWQIFGREQEGWGQVQAVCDWIHTNIRFGYKYARLTKSAYETYSERAGVCRDFMNLAVTFCRCLDIPARCATGYLGDIDIPASSLPMDFSSWFEVYLDNQWYTFDARYNIPRVGRVLMARGRDAVDVALITSFRPINLENMTVWAEEISSFDVGR